MSRFAMLNDATRCIGCRSCQVTCKEWNDRKAVPTRNRGGYENPPRLSSDTLTRIRFTEHERDGRVLWTFLKVQCMHCLHPGCVSVCTVGALRKTPEGPVVYDDRRCIGCRYCQYACPFGIPKYEWDNALGLIRKCDFCVDRLLAGREPACAAACPSEAITFGDRDALLADAHRRIAKHPDRYEARVYGEHEAGGTSVLCIGPVEPQAMGLPALGDGAVARFSDAVMKATPFTVAGVAAALTGLYYCMRRRERVRREETRS